MRFVGALSGVDCREPSESKHRSWPFRLPPHASGCFCDIAARDRHHMVDVSRKSSGSSPTASIKALDSQTASSLLNE